MGAYISRARGTDVPALDQQDLYTLARKYRALEQLRGRRDRGAPAATRDELRALATEFPGCLRELDTLGPLEITRRARACDLAATGANAGNEPWMAWIWTYHLLMRAVLTQKLRDTRARAGTAATLSALRADTGMALSLKFARHALRPPEGRVGPVVLRALGELFAESPTKIAETLFPIRRASPCRLD